jgi:DNA-binding CsgD family transcriptional regulator
METTDLTKTQRSQLGKLKKLHKQRSTALQLWRSPSTAYPALLELVVFKGVSTEEAGRALGVSREAIAKRIRPLKEVYGLSGRGLAARRLAEEKGLRRPFAKMGEDALIEKARAEMDKAEADRAALSTKAADLLGQMADLITALDASGVPDRIMAEALDVTPMTIYRFRRQLVS